MNKTVGKLTVYFEDPFWVGVVERFEDGRLSAAKITFGAEPKDYEVYDFVLKYYQRLHFSPAVAAELKNTKKNPKRIQREVQKQVEERGVGTKSQQALKLQQEQMKTERKQYSRKRRDDEKERLFELKQQQKKERHRGR